MISTTITLHPFQPHWGNIDAWRPLGNPAAQENFGTAWGSSTSS